MKRKIIIITFILASLWCFFDFFTFSLLGPPKPWGAHTAGEYPDLIRTDIPENFSDYVREIKSREKKTFSDRTINYPDSALAGEIFHTDIVPKLNMAVVLTHSGKYWVDDQHLYIGPVDGTNWKKLSLTENTYLSDATIVPDNGGQSILISRWNSWIGATYLRYLLSIFDEELRPENAIYKLDFMEEKLKYLFPGYQLQPSPDRNYVAFLVSQNGFCGYHTLMIYNCITGVTSEILSLESIDPCSGISFEAKWSADSRALLFDGETGGFKFHKEQEPGDFCVLYMVGNGVLYDIQSAILK